MKRSNESITSPLEEKLLQKLIPLIPRWISSDMLTFLAVSSSLAGGILYLFYPRYSLALVGVNCMLFINWLADSTDGKIAIYRNKPMFNYGYYIDHLLDSFSIIFLLGSLALSDATHTDSWLFAIAFLLIANINAYLKTSLLNIFDMSVSKFSPTDARIGLAIINFLTILVGNKQFIFFGNLLTLFDLIGGVFALIIIFLLIPDIIKTIKILSKKDNS